jgi:hypothetical protein
MSTVAVRTGLRPDWSSSGLAFAGIYSMLGNPLARLAERYSRVRIIAVATLVWSVMTMLCGTAK